MYKHLELSTSVVHESDSEIARRLSLVVGDALNAAKALHSRQPANFNDEFVNRKPNRDIQVKVRLKDLFAVRKQKGVKEYSLLNKQYLA